MVRNTLLVAALFVAVVAQGATIDRMTTRAFGGYKQTYNPSSGILLAGLPYVYYLSDSMQWSSGAGSYWQGNGKLVSETSAGGQLRYTIQSTSSDNLLMYYTDYDGGNHSAQGILGVWGDLTIVATPGSTHATISGYSLLISNDETYYGEPRFNFYSAPVGSLVPFTTDYTLSGTTWHSGMFSETFSYYVNGEFRFNEYTPVPEPSCLAVVVTGCMLLGRRGRVA